MGKNRPSDTTSGLIVGTDLKSEPSITDIGRMVAFTF